MGEIIMDKSFGIEDKKVDKSLGLIESYEPRSEVIIDEEYSEEFVRQLDNPKYNSKLAELFREAEDTYV